MDSAIITPESKQKVQSFLRWTLWRRGSLFYKLQDHQIELYKSIKNNTNKKFVVNCSRRFGKSFILCLLAIEEALGKKNIHIRFAAPTQKQLKEIIQPIMVKILDDCPDELKPEFKSQDNKYMFPNGSQIHIAGCDNGNAENLRGHESDLNLIDEAGFIDDLEYVLKDILMPQTLTTGGRTIVSSTPPRTPAHYFERLCKEAIQSKYYARYTIDDNTSIDDNIKQIYCEEAGGLNSTTWQREYLCQFVVDEAIVVVPEWRSDYIGEIELDAWRMLYHNYIAMDIGGRHKTAIIYGYYDFKKSILQVLDESILTGQDTTTHLIASTIRAKEHELFNNMHEPRRIADNNNVILLQDLSLMHDVHFAPTSKDTLIAMVNEVRVFVGQGRLRVHERCKELIGCLSTAIWNKQRTQFDVSDLYGHFDALASLVYMIRNLDQYTNPIPATSTATIGTHHINYNRVEQQSNLKKMFRR
jgi:hypothetical protein